MTTLLDSSGIYVCIRGPVIGYGDTPEAAEAMADTIEARAKRAKMRKANVAQKPRYRLNTQTMRYEVVTE